MERTIKCIVSDLLNREFFLPTIQRDFVWLKNSRDKKVEKLLDSLMSGYPIGQIIVWESEKQSGNINIYQFLGIYDYGKDFNENEKFNNHAPYLVLDGQQRLTALHLALRGKIKNKGENEYMYINLFHPTSDDQIDDLSYGFAFLTEQKASIFDNKNLWFQVGRIINDFNNAEEFKDLIFEEIEKKFDPKHQILNEEKCQAIKELLEKLWHNIREKKIHCEVTKTNANNLLNIFVRLNDGGVKLEKADLLLSFMESKEKVFGKKSAREEISSFLKDINGRDAGLDKKHIKLRQDDILKACLVMVDDLEIQYKISNFNNETVTKIAENWDGIKKAIYTTLNLMDIYRIDRRSLPSINSLLPIAYYLKKKNLLGDGFVKTNNAEYLAIQKNIIIWLAHATFKRVFGASSDTALKNIRDKIRENSDFSLPTEFTNESKFGSEDIESLVDKSKHKGRNTQLLLKLISPSESWKIVQDHIFSQDLFKDNEAWNKKYKDSILNLQLLGRSQNASKGKRYAHEWVKEQSEEYKKENLIPLNFDENNFEDFIKERRKLVIERLNDVFEIDRSRKLFEKK